jgi:tRNA(fMet)-specific endonuclease VapC
MILFDTDHLSILTNQNDAAYSTLVQRMVVSFDHDFAVSIISLEEQVRGWLADIARQNANARRQVVPYDRFQKVLEFYARWNVLSLTDAAAEEAERLRASRIRIGTSDRKIAAIALVNDATLITSNAVDFARVPGLRFEDWRHG